MYGSANILADGQQRAYDANFDRVRAEVEAEYAAAMKDASPWEAALLLLRIEREVQKRMEKIAPSDGLY